MYNNRLMLQEKVRKNQYEAKIKEEESMLYKPKINDSSHRLEESTGTKSSVEDRLLMKKKEYEKRRISKQEANEQEIKKKEIISKFEFCQFL